jgi:hypothetical protein
MPGAGGTRGRACRMVARALVTTVAPGSPGIPARDGVTAYFVLSLVTGLVCHHHRRDAGVSGPTGPTSPSWPT